MAKFNLSNMKLSGAVTTTTNLAGGDAYALKEKEELATILLTSFVQDNYYRSASDTLIRLHELACKIPTDFLMKAAVFSRDIFGMRSITHALAAHLAASATGTPGVRNFFDKIVVRVDDMLEILAYYQNVFATETRKNGKVKLPAALKQGFRRAFNRFNEYQLAKYINSGKEWSLIDVVNLVRPVPTGENFVALNALVNGNLKQFDTFATELSAAGSDPVAKGKALERLLVENKMGYLQLLRNLRNISQYCSSEAIQLACTQLVNEKRLANARIFPTQFVSAYYALQAANAPRNLLKAVSQACDLSVKYVPNLGNTAVVIDVSGSMLGEIMYLPTKDPKAVAECFATGRGKKTVSTIAHAAVLGAIAAKDTNSDVILFDGVARRLEYVPDEPVITIVERIIRNTTGGSTNFACFWEKLTRPFDRILILSDMQGWVTSGEIVKSCFNSYKQREQADPHVYSIDLAGYGSSQLQYSNHVHLLSGYSDKLFLSMEKIEKGLGSLVAEIEAHTI